MKCDRLGCEREAIVSGLCSAHTASGLIVPIKKTEEMLATEAAKFHAEMSEALKKVASTMDAAKEAGFLITFQVDQDRAGRFYVSTLVISKPFYQGEKR